MTLVLLDSQQVTLPGFSLSLVSRSNYSSICFATYLSDFYISLSFGFRVISLLLDLGFSILHSRSPSSFPFLLPLVMYTLRISLVFYLI